MHVGKRISVNSHFVCLFLLLHLVLVAVPSFAADKASPKAADKSSLTTATAKMSGGAAFKLAFERAVAARAEKKKLRNMMTSSYRLMRQGDYYGAQQKMWSLRKTLKERGDKVTLRKLERVQVLLQRGDEMAARVRMKSLLPPY